MADSNITKWALAAALKELLREAPFHKVSVGNICAKCRLSRKSFYYHFRDKYDLVNWVFDTEVIATLRENPPRDRWEAIGELCRCLYENRSFYSSALQMEGQNSLREHLREFLLPMLESRMEALVGRGETHRIGVDFFADGIVCAILRWLLERDCLPPERFVASLREVVEQATIAICQDMEKAAE